MKKIVVFLLLFPIFVCVYSNGFPNKGDIEDSKTSAGYSVSGVVKSSSLNGKTIYIMRFCSFDRLDSAVVHDNAYCFKGCVDSATLCYITAPEKIADLFILERGEIKIGSAPSFYPSGTAFNNELSSIARELDSMDVAYNKKKESFDSSDITKKMREQLLEKQWDPFVKDYRQNMGDRYIELCALHSNDALGLYTAVAFMKKADNVVRERAYSILSSGITSNPAIRRDIKQLNNEKKADYGIHFIDAKGLTIEGKEISLSDYIGKGRPVVMDIWASWCVPCRAEIPYLRDLYQKYHEKGLDIVGVFIKDTQKNLQRMISKEDISWPQIFDEKGDILTAYGAAQIPQILLFDGNGIILQRNLRGRDLQNAVRDLFESGSSR